MKKTTAISLILLMIIFVVSGCETTPPPKPEPLPSLGLTSEPVSDSLEKQDLEDQTSIPTVAPDKHTIYKIKRGDTLGKIAKKVYGDSGKWRILKDANPDINPKNLKLGDEIKIPQNGDVVLKPAPTPKTKSAPCKKYDCYEHTIKPGQSLMDISNLYYGTHHQWRIIAKTNRIGKKTALKVGQKLKIPKTDQFRKPDKRKVKTSLPANYKYEEYKIRKGDNLGLIANKFYKDNTKWATIAEANSINIKKPDLKVGQIIKIPVINGFAKIEKAAEKVAKTEKEPVTDPQKSVATKQSDTANSVQENEAAAEPDKISEENIAAPKEEGIKLYDNKQYKEAIAEFNKAINGKADDQEVARYMSLSYFQLGEGLFAQKDYMGAKTEYEKAWQYDSKCSECKPNIEKCIALYCGEHYEKGKAYFKKNQPGKAYDEWKSILDANPEYKDVKKLIKLVEKFKS